MRDAQANGDTAADAIVVGAGPAGATTALLLARLGLQVELLDRARFPRPKACGDCLSAAATRVLRQLGLLDRVMAAGASTLEGWRIVAPDGTVAMGLFPDTPSLSIERKRLDAALLDAALDAGARLRRAHVHDVSAGDGRVRGVVARLPDGSGRTFSGRLVVGADGLRSILARRLDRVRRTPRLRKLSLTAHVPIEGSLRYGEMHVLDGGCIGYAPAGAGRCNLTLVVDQSRATALAEHGRARFFRDWLARAPRLAPRLGDELSAVDRLQDDDFLASGPFDWPSKGAAERGAALVGDAAGYYDPFTGQGVFQALTSAQLLVAAVGPVLTDRSRSPTAEARAMDRALRRYARRKQRATRSTRRVQWLIEQVLSRPALADRALDRLARAPTAMHRVIEVTGDLRPPRSLLSPTVASSFLFPSAGGPFDTDR